LDPILSIIYSTEKNSVEVKGTKFSYPSSVIGPDSTQEMLYDSYMPKRIEGFLDGFNCNIMAYGQTGTGKTHTMFGPPGYMARASKGEFGMKVIPEYGLFPRGMIELYNKLQALREGPESNSSYVMTVSAVELALEGNLDMFVKSKKDKGEKLAIGGLFGDGGAMGVSIDRSCSPARLYGMTELLLNSPEDVLRTFRALASRNTAGTTMNDSSSRSHCFVFLNLYQYGAGSVRTSMFQFVDLAGSERIKDAHGGNTNVHGMEATKGMYQGLMTNFSLLMLSKVIRELVELRQKGKKFEHVVNNPTQGDLVSLLGQSLVGSALTAIFVCVSQAPANAQQSRHALEFGETFSKLTMDRIKPMPSEPIDKMREAAEACLEENKANLESDSNNKYVVRRQAMARDAMARIQVLDQFSSGEQ